MSKATADPIRTVFQFQRTAVEGAREAAARSIDANAQASTAVLEGLEAGQAVQQRNAALAKAAVDAYFDALEASTPADAEDLAEVRAAVDEGFERADELGEESWDALEAAVTEAFEAYDAAADASLEAVDSSFDAFLDAHEQVEANVTEAAETAADAVEIDVEGE